MMNQPTLLNIGGLFTHERCAACQSPKSLLSWADDAGWSNLGYKDEHMHIVVYLYEYDGNKTIIGVQILSNFLVQ